jgi:hypothetical protein
MRWSKLRKLVEDNFAPSVRARVSLHVTQYPKRRIPYHCGCLRGWFEIDKVPIAHFDTHISLRKYRDTYHEHSNHPWHGHPAIGDDARTPGQLVEPGEFSGDDLTFACWAYLHVYTLDESLASDNPLLVALAVLNAKVGKRGLQRVSQRSLHPLTRALLQFRMAADAAQRQVARAAP